MNLSDRLNEDLKQAQLNREELKVGVLRMLISEVRYAQIAKNSALTEADYLAVVQKELKKRKEASESFSNAGRAEQAGKEDAEAEILMTYLPAQLSDEELTQLVSETIKEVGVNSVQDMGRVIGVVMSKVQGQADGGRVSSVVKELLSQ